MRRPWDTLLGQYEDHWFLGDYLEGDVPRIQAIKADERWWSLSSGEQAMILAAEAMLRIHEAYLVVDDENKVRLENALALWVAV